jgi:hypothetical protein
LSAALSDKSGSSWPDAHYLGPLHPVLDWAADRALANLGRNEVFAVRGTVDAPTALLLGTLTNRRGQVVAASWLTVEFPEIDPSFGLVTVHDSVREALAATGLDQERSNPGPVHPDDLERLQRLIPPAVAQARDAMDGAFAASTTAVAARVDRWSRRLDAWEQEADVLIQRSSVLRQQRTGVQQERQLVSAMAPDRQLIRPLLVIVPDEQNGAA